MNIGGGYGIAFSNYSWFQWYYGVTGIHDPRFLPYDFYRDVFVPYYNRKEFVAAWRDKNYFDSFLGKEYLPYLPKTIIKKAANRFYDNNNNYLSAKEAWTVLFDSTLHEEVIIKMNESSFGKGVSKYLLSDVGQVKKLKESFEKTESFIAQEVIHQHPFFAQFNPSSVNILRINTLFLEGKVEVTDTVFLRFGKKGHHTDVVFDNGREIITAAGISAEGHLLPDVFDLYGEKKDIRDMINVTEWEVPGWVEILKMVKEAALRLPYFSWVAWDVTVADSGKPIIIEYNILGPGSVIYQYRGPFLGGMTEKALEFLKDENKRKELVPVYLRKA